VLETHSNSTFEKAEVQFTLGIHHRHFTEQHIQAFRVVSVSRNRRCIVIIYIKHHSPIEIYLLSLHEKLWN